MTRTPPSTNTSPTRSLEEELAKLAEENWPLGDDPILGLLQEAADDALERAAKLVVQYGQDWPRAEMEILALKSNAGGGAEP